MIITKVTRTYSRSINTKTYGAAESWVKIESTYEAQCESGDDPLKVSTMLYDQCKKEVVENVTAVTEKIKQSLNQTTTPPSMPANGQSTAGAPLPGSVPANGSPRSL